MQQVEYLQPSSQGLNSGGVDFGLIICSVRDRLMRCYFLGIDLDFGRRGKRDPRPKTHQKILDRCCRHIAGRRFFVFEKERKSSQKANPKALELLDFQIDFAVTA